MGQFVVKIFDILSTHHMNPWVNYQADMYMSADGVRYEVTDYPEHVDMLGVLCQSKQLNQGSKPLPSMDQPGTSTNPGVSTPSFDAFFPDLTNDNDKGKTQIGNEWNDQRARTELRVTKVFQYDLVKEVYRDSLETYYATTKPWSIDLPVAHEILVEKTWKHSKTIRDKWGNNYRTMEWGEVRELTWKGIPLFMEVSAKDTALPGTSAFQGERGPPP